MVAEQVVQFQMVEPNFCCRENKSTHKGVDPVNLTLLISGANQLMDHS